MRDTCCYKIINEPQISGMRIWMCSNPDCEHIEFAPFRFKDWKFCPYCGNTIIAKEGLILKAEVNSKPAS